MFKNQHHEVIEANELNHQIDEFEQGESGYLFENIKKLTVKMFRYHDTRASSYCILSNSFCSSTSIVNIRNGDIYCFLWSILAHKYKVDTHRERVSHYEKDFHKFNQFSMRLKDIPTYERLNNLNINVFEL